MANDRGDEHPTAKRGSGMTHDFAHERAGKIHWIVVVAAVVIAAYLALPKNWMERLSLSASAQLPACGSPLVFAELSRQYGKVVSQVASLLPANLLFEVRRARQIDANNGSDSRYCEAEYTSIIGAGRFTYRLEWFDKNRRTSDALSVTIDDASAPDLVRAAGIFVASKLNASKVLPQD